MTSFVIVCDVKSADKRYADLKIVNSKMKMNMTCVLSHPCLGSLVVSKLEFRLNSLCRMGIPCKVCDDFWRPIPK